MMPSRAERQTMLPGERRAALSLAAIFSTRMLGLFMVMPVFAVYAGHLEGQTPLLIGLAIGAYGLTQAIFQIPFGLLSDRIGRKPVILAGLLLFALGSVVAANSSSIYGVIVGRLLQGSGAIAAAVMALAADLSREEHRTKTMAIIGMSIGLSFALAMVLGPLITGWFGLSGLFWTIALLALVGIGILYLFVPNPSISRVHRDSEPVPAQFKQVLTDTQLLRLDFGILVLHMILTASFVVLPLLLRDSLQLEPSRHGWVYLSVLFASVLAMIPFVIQAESHRKMKPIFLAAISMIMVSEFMLAEWHGGWVSVIAALFVFYVGFNILEATLPSLISKVAPTASKGTAMGFYSSSQFFGAFLGGVLGGWLHTHFGVTGVFLFCSLAALAWLILASSMKSPRYLTTKLVGVGEVSESQAQHLARKFTEVPGVAEVVVIAEEGVAYLKVDRHALDEDALAAVAPATV